MGTGETVRVEVLVFDGCPHAEVAIGLAHAVAGRLGPGITVERIDVNTPERAAECGFLGSPSIRVNGLDVEGKTTSLGRLCCRTYDRGSGMPSEWLIEAAVLRALSPRGVLFLCVANSARSQLAEGIARFLAPTEVTVWSAGSSPTRVRPEAIAVLAEIGIDISTHQSKAVSDIPAGEVDTVITLCGEEECPVFLGGARRLHWGLPDPTAMVGSDADRLDAFRRTRDELRRRLTALFAHDAPEGIRSTAPRLEDNMSHEQRRTGFVGGGRVTRVLVGGWRHAGALPTEILVNEPDDAAFARLAEQCPEVHRATMEEAAAADVVFLALHPPVLALMLPALRPCLSAQALVVSLAPKIPLSTLTAGLGTARVVRMIPNAPSIIGRGYNPVAFGDGLDATARENVSALFAPWGARPEVQERDLEAYAILTGMGPTYYWYQWQALREAAGQFGLAPERADEALRHMLDGALATLLQSGLPPAGVMDLIPVRPLQAIEESVTAAYGTALPSLFAKIRPTT